MSLYKKFLLLSRFKQIFLVVATLHLFILFALLSHHLISKKPAPPKPIVIRTVTPNIQVVTAPNPKPQKKPQSTAKPVAVSHPKKTPNPAIKPTSTTKTKAIEPSTKPPKETPLFHQESRPTLTIPAKIKAKQELLPTITSEEAKKDPTYGEYLIAYLQNALDLPEYGDVKAKLEIDRFGRLISCDIIDAKSQKNGEFIKNQLPELTFPCLNDFGILDATHNFTITFKNAENH